MAYYDDVPFYPESSVGYLTHRVQQQSSAAMEPLFAREGITKTQWTALVSIGLDRATTCVDLARDLAHDKGAMTRLLDQLEERGLIARERSGEDRRYVRLALTEDGVAVTERCRRRVAECWNRWLDEFPTKEVDQVLATLRRLAQVIAAAPLERAE